MQNPIAFVTKRTLETLTSDLAAFLEHGGNIKHAKDYNNVIHERLFNVEISQVGITEFSEKQYLLYFLDCNPSQVGRHLRNKVQKFS